MRSDLFIAEVTGGRREGVMGEPFGNGVRRTASLSYDIDLPRTEQRRSSQAWRPSLRSLLLGGERRWFSWLG
jgi:hypothetical protein